MSKAIGVRIQETTLKNADLFVDKYRSVGMSRNKLIELSVVNMLDELAMLKDDPERIIEKINSVGQDKQFELWSE